ncbi:putative leucine-rich repeat receptor-like serine/threonine-protein kinase [Iris pallida]|uniref:non-specific serine/threonine protein kinase n=1 Tax=Iris pallida TaxID=29817 RepID=A0AAX6I4E6_IRIPA|nr:putative leucine-rich repeat receptor-like serine/threonine-protein kinase [Iris pallida]
MKIRSFPFVLTQLLLLLPSLVLPSHSNDGISIDRQALLAFKKAIVADEENAALGNWNETVPLCEWNGVTCDTKSERVVELDLKSKYLQGTISPFLSNLSFLQLLELSDNSLQGAIPAELGALSNLGLLGVEGNELQHVIPSSFGMLSQLRYIDLSNNQLHGDLLISLFDNCTQLSYVDLSNNWFTGFIPPEIGNRLPNLEHLLLYLNQLGGTIPDSLSNSTQMVEIDLENNFFSGKLPSNILNHMPSLRILHLSYNKFSSDDFNSNLEPFFSSIANLTHLEELELAGNNLGGELPSKLGHFKVNLTQIYLQDNFIYGVIPSIIANLSNLMTLNLSNNHLNGTIPLELILLPNLQRLWLSNNLLCGEVPSPPYVLKNLGLVDLSRNNLSGAIPDSLGNLTNLRRLILYGNFLSGSIPSSLGTLNLELLDLSHNRLTGKIPSEVAGLSTMEMYFNLSNNMLEGSIPTELSNMDKVREVDLSCNNLVGAIPPNLGGCVDIELINLSRNRLEGPVPWSLGNLFSLQYLDLSSNFLSGDIPSSLQKCTGLKQLILSYNNFSGPLPEGGIFDSLTLESVQGNHFCGSLSGIPTCKYITRRTMHSKKSTAILVSVVFVLGFLSTILIALGYRYFVRAKLFRSISGFSSNSVIAISANYPRITYRELAEATGGFDSSRLIGSGSFGQVYRGLMNDGSEVAVKVLQLQSGNSTRSFNRECQVLKRIRHRNLMHIITACSLPDFKALVLPFMANGSLENHLHPQGRQSSSMRLSLIGRVNICSDVAEGMAYLHHHSPVQVIHCDLKPSNILLNEDMTALVSDFGISRLVMTVDERKMMAESTDNSIANLLCGSVGYVAPEYGYGRSASVKGDVYSFGILVLEMITRKRPTDDMFSGGQSLRRWVSSHYRDQLDKVIDISVMNELSIQCSEIRGMWEVALLELLEIGLRCTQYNPSTRPTMLDAADDLNRLKRYLAGDATATFTSSLGMSSSTFMAGDSF